MGSVAGLQPVAALAVLASALGSNSSDTPTSGSGKTVQDINDEMLLKVCNLYRDEPVTTYDTLGHPHTNYEQHSYTGYGLPVPLGRSLTSTSRVVRLFRLTAVSIRVVR